MSEIHAPTDPDLHHTRYHVIPLSPDRDQVLDERSYPTAAEAAGKYCENVHNQELPATAPGDLLHTELTYGGQVAIAQWWTAGPHGLRKISEDEMFTLIADQLTRDTEEFLQTN